MLSGEKQQQLLTEEAALLYFGPAQKPSAQCAVRLGSRSWLKVAAVVWMCAALWFLYARSVATLDEYSGGITTSILIDRCEQQLLSQFGQFTVQFPTQAEAAQQISLKGGVKHWNGWLESASRFSGRAEFVCQYHAPTNSVSAQILQ